MKIPRRINVVGSSGAGKSTVSKRLADLLSIPSIEMDALFWGPDWHWPSDEEFFGKLERALEREDWILDGNYPRTTFIKWQRVETVVWLDYSFVRTFLQSIRRAFVRSWTRQEIWPGTGNCESFRKSFFSKDSIILWSITNHGKIRKRYQKMILDPNYAHIEFVRLTGPRQTECYFRSLEILFAARAAQ